MRHRRGSAEPGRRRGRKAAAGAQIPVRDLDRPGRGDLPATRTTGPETPLWPSEPRCYLLDLDGVLVRTEELHHEAYRRACAERGHHLDWSFPRYCLAAHYGQERLRDELAAALPGLFDGPEAWASFHRRKSQLYLQLLGAGPVPLQPGAAELLGLLAAAGTAHAVVTNASREQTALLRLGHAVLDGVACWVTREEYAAAKPAPDAYRLALERLGARGEAAVGFEDTPRGIQALAAAGVRAVLVTAISYPELGATPWLRLDSLASLPVALRPTKTAAPPGGTAADEP